MVPAALGTQTAGSVLRPAAYCGFVGLKPTFGRISRRNVFPNAWSLDTMGVITRDVRDAALVLRSLAGYDPLDDGSVDHPIDHYRAGAEAPTAPTLGLIREFVDRSQPDVREHIQSVASRLDQAGASPRELHFPLDVDFALACQLAIHRSEATEVHATMHARDANAYLPRLRASIEVGRLIPGAAYVRAQRWRRRMRQAVDEQLGTVDALMLPTASGVAPEPTTTGDTSFQAVWTMLGLPAISLPSGLNAERLPFAVQLVGKAWQEAPLMSAARWCEQAIGSSLCPI